MLFKKFFKSFFSLAFLIGFSFSAIAADYNLRMTMNSNDQDEDYDGSIVFKNYVESASNGKISVELFVGTQLCSKGAECLQGVSDGSIDIYISTSGGAAGVFPYVQVLDLPYLIIENVKKRQIANPSDMKGLKIRTVVADLPQELVRALGASPTPIPWPELFTSFQTGVVEGSKNGITDIMNMKFPDAGLKYVTLDGHAYMGALWWMNNAKYESMPKDLRKVVTDGFYALQQATFASPKRKSIKAYEDFVAGGGSLYVPTPDQKAAFKKAASPVYDWFKANVKGGKEIFNALTSAVGRAENRASSDYKKDL